MLRYLAVCLFAVSGIVADKALFETKCVGCHALPDPLSLNDKQWVAVLNTMQQRMREAGKPALSEEQLKKIRCYLNTEAGRPCS
ncbi:MAG: cytochrome c [Turneriella sp.]